uniref:Uncharacterized protein n=1 Tax=Pyxicephalus adspersus TaxID=30357 RepID=A0AAV2ZW29_PYXAD|nr:TPA: hypothetical protein GDO54_003554 [Pyxicephalus adspersus]
MCTDPGPRGLKLDCPTIKLPQFGNLTSLTAFSHPSHFHVLFLPLPYRTYYFGKCLTWDCVILLLFWIAIVLLLLYIEVYDTNF